MLAFLREHLSAAGAAWTAMRSHTGLRRVLVAYWLYCVVEISAWMVIVFWAYGRGGASLAGAAAVVQLVPAALLAPVLAGVGDRMSRGSALVLAHAGVALASAATAIAVAVDASAWVVIAASATVTCTVAVVRPIHYAALPQLANSADELVSANALSSAGEQLAILVGPVLAGFGVELVGASAVLAALTAMAVAGVVLCVRLGMAAPVSEQTDDGPGGVWDGLVTLSGDAGSLALLLALMTTFVLGGALDVLGVAFGETVLHDGASSAGLVVGASGIGGLLGAALATFAAGRRRLVPAIAVVGAAQGIAFALVSRVSDLVPAMTLIAVVGTADALLMVCGRTLLQRSTDDRVLSRVFAVQESTSLLGLAIGTGLAPLLINATSPSGAFLPLGLAAAVLVLTACLFVGRLDDRAVYRPQEVALLRTVPYFRVLPAYSLERLAAVARWRDIDAGSVVLQQGEVGEWFYVVGDGTFSVTIDGTVMPHRLGPGAGFGEIALLHRVPRTATITAVTPGRLLGVRAPDFLAAVTESPEGSAIAAEVAAQHLARSRATQD